MPHGKRFHGKELHRKRLGPGRRLMAFCACILGVFALIACASDASENNSNSKAGTEEAIFAGGCFWCMEPPYDTLDGVHETISGYTGGHVENPSYEQVSRDDTGHAEAVRVVYDPEKVSYEQLLEVFWRNIDPLDDGGQFCDRGDSYRAEIFFLNEEQKTLAEQSKAQVAQRFGRPIATDITPADTFYPAEDYHQNYYQRNPIRYKFYRSRCGRDRRLEEIWGSN